MPSRSRLAAPLEIERPGRGRTTRTAGAPGGAIEAPAAAPIHDQVYDALKTAIVTGQIVPGRAVTLRGLAATLGVSPMPVREAIRRISAEGGLVIHPNRRVSVPDMTRARFDEVVAARSLLEPEAAARALPHIDAARLARIRAADDDIERALETGDVEDYMASNHRFHFEIYGAARSEVLVPLIESVWLRFGPFMRLVYGRFGTAILIDQHERAIEAIAARDEAGLRAAIRADILDGMNEIGAASLVD